MNNIGIIGLGYVGEAIADAYYAHQFYGIVKHDPLKTINATTEDLLSCQAIFVCVPTPRKEDGSCDSSILESVLDMLAYIKYEGVIISKCTATPDVYEQLSAKHGNLVHIPEFLTAANASKDYLSGRFAIIGGRIRAYMHEAERIVKIGQPNLEWVEFCSIKEAALAKYAVNTFLATKVVFFNELYNLCQATGADYKQVQRMFLLDDRIGPSHTSVPGSDGNQGFGGHCFPKDTEALLQYAESVNSPLDVLDSAVKKNTLLRLK